MALSTFHKIFQKSFLLADIVQLHKYQVLAFINGPTTCKRTQGSGKFRIWKVLIAEWFTSEGNISLAIFFKTLVVQN